MATCTFNSVNGINKDCEAFLSATKAGVFFDPDFSFASMLTAKTYSNWKAAIDTNLKAFVPRAFRSTEPTDAEAVVETDGFGSKLVTAFNAPSLNVYMSSNPCDYQEMVKLGSQLMRVIPLMEDGSKMATVTSTGIVKGFECQVIARPISPKGRENKLQQYMVMINFTNIDEFQNAVYWKDTFGYTELVEENPSGYTLEKTAALSTATQAVKIYKRCKETVLGTNTFTSEILEYYTIAGTTPVVTVGSISNGLSNLLVYSTGTTALASGEWVKFRLVKKTASVYDEITNDITVSVP